MQGLRGAVVLTLATMGPMAVAQDVGVAWPSYLGDVGGTRWGDSLIAFALPAAP